MARNCLKGVRCPECGHEGGFRIAGTTLFDVTVAGAKMVGEAEWDDASRIKCRGCGHIGTVRGFSADRKANCRQRKGGNA